LAHGTSIVASRARSSFERPVVPFPLSGLLDYPKLIKNPMDLGTIKDKLKKKGYKTLRQLNDDVNLVWTNCMTYNQDGSDFYKLADSLHRKWDDKFSKLLHEAAGSEKPAGSSAAAASTSASSSTVPGGAAALKDKRDFAKQLFMLSKEDLGRVLVEVEARCPAAIVRNETEDEIELNVDRISAPVLQELAKFVDAAAKSSGKPKKKSASAAAATGAASTKKTKTG
jgi:Bromodomain/Bromodomain extra-terminal - transcription regulation